MLATTTCFTSVSGSASCSTAAKFSSTTMASAPESLSWNSSSRGLYSGLTFTTVMPARRMPAIATGYCSTFGIMMATRAPRLQPLALQPGGEGARGLVELGIGQGLAHADAGVPGGVGPEALLEHRDQRRIVRRVDLGGRHPADNAAAKAVPLTFLPLPPASFEARPAVGSASDDRERARVAIADRATDRDPRLTVVFQLTDPTPPNGTSGLSVRAARSGRSMAAVPTKASNSSRTVRSGRSRVMNTSRVRWSSSGQRSRPCGRVEDVLHAVHHHRRVGHFGELHDALDAQAAWCHAWRAAARGTSPACRPESPHRLVSTKLPMCSS